MKGKKGITLIALVITIIVLLILAGVTIATLTGNYGLLTKAGDAKLQSEIAEEKEQIQLGYQKYEMSKYTDQTPTFTVEGATEVKSKANGWQVTFASGRVYNITSEGEIKGKSNPANIILVLDLSSSMTNHDAVVITGGGEAVYDSLDTLDKNKIYYTSESSTTMFCEDGQWKKRYRYKAKYKTVNISSASDCPAELYQRRVDSLVDACRAFISSMDDESRLAIVGFNSIRKNCSRLNDCRRK